MALCVSGWMATVAACSRFFPCALVSTPGVALEDIVKGVTRNLDSYTERVVVVMSFSWALRKRRGQKSDFIQAPGRLAPLVPMRRPVDTRAFRRSCLKQWPL